MGISRDQVLQSDTLAESVDGHIRERNGMNSRMISSIEKSREMKGKVIKNALAGISELTTGTKYSFYKRNPNLLIPNGGILMMREKSTMDVIAQMGQAG